MHSKANSLVVSLADLLNIYELTYPHTVRQLLSLVSCKIEGGVRSKKVPSLCLRHTFITVINLATCSKYLGGKTALWRVLRGEIFWVQPRLSISCGCLLEVAHYRNESVGTQGTVIMVCLQCVQRHKSDCA
jgi:hypothetical protein